MKFTTIWTMPACTLREKLRRTRDWAAQKTGHALPLRVRYWVTMGELAKATTDSSNVLATPLDQLLRDMDAPRSMS